MYRDEKSTSLGHVGRAETQSLPNIALPAALPEIQVSSEESSSRKSSTESREFWEETTRLLQELSILREDVAELACPCRRAGCPFKHEERGRPHGARTRRRSTLHSIAYGANSDASGLARKNVVSYLASMREQKAPRGAAMAVFRQDCLVTEEPLALLGQDYFVRSAPSRKAQRRHSTAIRVSNSYPTTMNSLAVPCCLDLRHERWCSLPDGMDRQLGSSLDSLDSEKLQDIQKSFLRRQRLHRSSIELEQW